MIDTAIETIARSLAMDVHHSGKALGWTEEERAMLWASVSDEKRAHYRLRARAALDAARLAGFVLEPHDPKQTIAPGHNGGSEHNER